MSINVLMLRNLRKNIRNYYLYVFALVFSVALYFAFVTLQYDPSMDAVEGSVKGGAAIKAASVLLVGIVSIFLLYANTIFIKRRGKEIGLFQLIGMTKGKIFRILSAENFILYFGSLILGIAVGFSVSKLILMILFKTIGVDAIASLRFSNLALVQTLIVFFIIYLLIMLMNYSFIKRQSILSLFRVTSTTEGTVKKLSFFEMIIGIAGIGFIILGYSISSRLFSGDLTSMTELSIAMITILASVIIGTYLFYKGSVSFIFHLIRKQKNGYLNIKEVLSLSSIMFRMKSNAVLLTVITTVSALAIGLLSLSYISFYSTEKNAKLYVPSDFILTDIHEAERFKEVLTAKNLVFTEKKTEVIQVDVNVKKILGENTKDSSIISDIMTLPVISEKALEGIDVSPDETYFTKTSSALDNMIAMKDKGPIELKGLHEVIPQAYEKINMDAPILLSFTGGGLPVAIVDETIFERLQNDLDPALQRKSSLNIGIDMKDRSSVEQANDLFQNMKFEKDNRHDSQLETKKNQKETMGLIMFIVAFLGLTFLITSGCILYFKQMDESENEKPNYTILRKLGFTQGDLLRGIQMKQLFNFGIPLVIGLLHSYFAVKSGWFFFGTELWTPMILVMLLYTALYSIFAVLSVFYYKKVIKESL
ncbi:bacitracin transport system permease protein [Paenibacillus sp. PastF-3]|uniref:FtsX-like permease family protein n=1 Tax=unclassified Paenibacillus TaxID=185978 RepID=UPI000B9FC60A|nr:MULTISPECIES: ABC transporter permease [unclassified Paenibacillus]MDH6370851.1 bacitracin transport system permease protein [Paenibacillus sp. PastF-3]OZQ85024.1 bacitracin ABC transporter permease [Paenibacillus sp. VTT E-133291]